jgi:hypothetical protein
MPKDLEKVIDPTPGLAGGPQPAPPGVSDGMPRPAPARPETPPHVEPDVPAPTRGDEEVDGEGARSS